MRDTDKIFAENRKARHDYHVLETFEAGLALMGTEVKAIREGRANLRESYCKLNGGEAFLLNAHIGQYSHGGSASHDPLRPRKLLLKRTELNKLLGKTTEKGLTIVPLKLYFSRRGARSWRLRSRRARRRSTSARRSNGAKPTARHVPQSRRGGYNCRR